MTGFLFRKFFYDMWDNFFRLLLLNFGFLILLALAFVLPAIIPDSFSVIVFIAILYLVFVFIAMSSSVISEISDYGSFGVAAFFKTFGKKSLVTGLIHGAASFLIFFLIRYAVPFYFLLGGWPGTILASLCFWTAVSFAGMLQFYPAVRSRLEKHPFRALKKCLIIFVDNPLFAFSSLAVSTVFTVLTLTCPSWPLLYLDQALRLRLLKYDWLEARAETGENGAVKNSRIPWDEILAEEKEKTGRRGFKDFIFPWRGIR